MTGWYIAFITVEIQANCIRWPIYT